MIIYFLRHASAGQHKVNPAKDEKRPLDKDGIEQSHDIGRALAALDVQVDAIISSPLKRATQTAALVANELGHDSKLMIETALRPEASYTSFRDLLRKYANAEAIMVVGHNPNLSEFLSQLISNGQAKGAVDLKKGAVARVETAGKRPGELKWCVTPKMVRTLYESVAASSLPKTSRK